MFNKLLKKLINLKRIQKQFIIVFFDSIVIVSVLLISFSLSSLSQNYYWYWPKEATFWIIFGAPVIAIPVFISFRLYRSVVRYTGFRAVLRINQAVTLYAFVWGFISSMSNHPYMMSILMIDSNPFASSGIYFEDISRSIIFINWMLAVMLIGGSRLLASWLFNDNNLYSGRAKNKVIIYGAGSAGRQLSMVLQSSKEYIQVAYIDDDLAKEKAYINNIPVFSYNNIEKLIEKNNISDILLALPSISRKKRNKIIKKLSLFSVHVRSLPSISELAGGKVKIDDLLEIDIEDLLGREPINPNNKLLKTNISNKVVLVTGAGGSIGSELCRQILFQKPKKIILYEISEPSLYLIEKELVNMDMLNVEVHPIIGSISDKERMKVVCNYYGVQTIYHAAAYKHVPLVELNPAQGILNNAIGTMNAAEAAISANVETFVLISTDKAVRPSSVMGASKRVAELVLQALAKQTNNTRFTMVRFGNVLDSSGSVIPLFKQQINAGGPITVTHSKVTRYFMTIPEAVELVIQAGAMAKGGEVFVLNMGEPVLIYDLAVKMIKLSGLQVLDENNPEGDIEIKYTGLRPGEKLYEELLVDGNFSLTENKLIMRSEEEMISWDKLEPVLAQIKEASKNSDTEKIYNLLSHLVPGFHSTSNGFDALELD